MGELVTPGTIIVAGGEFLRFGGFVNSMLDLRRPEGTVSYIHQSVSIVENLNECIRKMRGDWIHIQADDHIFDNTLLLQLLAHDVDVVVPLMVKRSPPFSTVIYKDYQASGSNGRGWMPYAFSELPEKGLFEVEGVAGTGGMVVRKHVLDAIGDPWFEYEAGEKLNEDFVFCKKIRAAGFKIWCDVEAHIGHRGMFTAWPMYADGEWSLGLNMGASTNGKSNTIVIKEG